MRDDLSGAYAAVKWAEAHIPVLQDRFVAWERRRPYEIVVEPDPADPNWEIVVVNPRVPLDPLIYGDVGATINSTRTALDILMSAVLARHGIKPNSKAHFPIRKTPVEFLASVKMLEDKQWISPIEAAAIKRTKAYEGGDHYLHAIHRLDILRKHERLLTVKPFVSGAMIGVYIATMDARIQQLDDKTILCRFPAGSFRPTPCNSHITQEIFLNEPTAGVADKPAILALRVFTERVKALIQDFP